MKLVRVFEHKGESYQLYEFRGVYLHPGVGRHKKTIMKRKGLQYIKNENYFMCKEGMLIAMRIGYGTTMVLLTCCVHLAPRPP